MKKLFTYSFFTFLLFTFSFVKGQQLVIDSTRFITGDRAVTNIVYAIPTADRGILFVGYEGYGDAGGIIPPFPLDTTYENVFIGKIDSNQHISWLKVYGGSKSDYAWSACQTPDGGYAVLATTESDDGDITNLIGFQDLWLLRLDASGNLLWQKTYGSTTGGTEAMSIANTPDHGFIMLGNTDGSDVDVPFHYGGYFSLDWLVVKTDSIGHKQWSKDIGGTGNEIPYGSILSKNGGYYLVSSTNSTDHDCTDTAWHIGVNTGDDYYVLRLDTAGNVLWDSSYGGSGDDIVRDAIFDPKDSSIVITGSGGSTDYIETDQHGEGDMLTLKINKNGTLIWHKSLGGPSQEVGFGIACSHDNGYMVYGSTFPTNINDTITGDIGQQDCWLFYIDSAGNEITNKIFGGTNNEFPASVVSYLNGYAATGLSGSVVFTEGSTSGNATNDGGAFISYINYWPLSTPNISANTGQLSLYPNPSQKEVRIIPPANTSGDVIIINTIGQIIYTAAVKQGQQYIDVNTDNWAQGIYIAKWQGVDGNVLTARMVNE